jgi:hypothetical protein
MGKFHDVFYYSRTLHWTFEKYLEERGKIFNDPHYKKLPNWARSYISGACDILWNDLYLNHLEWRLYYNGKLWTKEELREQEKIQDDLHYQIHLENSPLSGHYWKNTDKVWTYRSQ